ncbi:MAG: HAD family phosphatase [Pirellulales bacterium]|nr:HAD family phosphatase [Pirellulales bacterium]
MRLPSEPILAVVFDHDGLIFNTEELYQQVGTQLLARRGKTFDLELLDQIMGRPPQVSFPLMINYHGLTDTPEQLARESTEIFTGILDDQLQTMPGLLELLELLEARQIPKAVGTSSGRRFVQKCLGKFELEPRFEFLLTAEDVTHGKPDPEIYLAAARRLQVPPAQMLVLEDSQTGCRAAVAAGAYAVAVPGGHSLRHDFTGAAFIADSLADPRIREVLGVG